MMNLKVAARALAKTPGFSAVAILTIAVATGANTALFSAFDRLVLHPVTIADPASLVTILNGNPQFATPIAAVSWPRYEEIRDHATSFKSLALTAFDSFTLTGNGEPEQLNGLRVTASFLPTLGVPPARGRNFTPAEDAPHGANVCLLSHELWESRFGSRDQIVGETITLNGQSWEVIGVLPPRLSAPFGQVQVFTPRVFEVGGLTAMQIERGAGYAQAIARLRPGVSLEQAASELQAIGRGYKARDATRLDADNTNTPQPFVDFLVSGLEPTFYTLLGAVLFVLLIACANVASLFLGRLAGRNKEVAVRQSLGATRGRIVWQFLVESAVFCAIAGSLGVLLAQWALSGIQALVASQLPPDTVLRLDWRALAFTAGITLACALLVGIAPAFHTSRTTLVEALKDSTRGSSSARGGRLRAALIVVEVALSVVLLVGSALLLLTFIQLQRTPPGFDPTGVAAAFVSVPAERYGTPTQQAAFFDAVNERLRAHPQVTAAATAIGLPISGFNPRAPYSVEGQPILPLPQRAIAGVAIVSDGYFDMLRIPFVAGRPITADDREGAPGVCVINESLAKKLFPAGDALGHVLRRGRDAEFRAEIVGVIRDVKTLGLNVPPPDEIYYSMRQLPRPGMAIAAKTTGDPAMLQSILRSAVADVDRNVAISFFATMDTTIAQSLGIQRIVAWLTLVFAAIALVLAVVGLYAVVSYAVGQRTAEIGIRMALGAQAGQVRGLVMRSGLRLVAVGLALGLVAAGGAARLIQTLLFNVQPLDPRIYAAVALLFFVVAALACFVPSFRASKIDPLEALRVA
ncbi:MAG TPA: ABC transporter permease [Vicinamibacterales bacterium]|nr:ABC transporter permease [Vicinamibacterales bacterium]